MGTIDIIVKRIHFGEDGVWKELKEEEMTILETETVGSLHNALCYTFSLAQDSFQSKVYKLKDLKLKVQAPNLQVQPGEKYYVLFEQQPSQTVRFLGTDVTDNQPVSQDLQSTPTSSRLLQSFTSPVHKTEDHIQWSKEMGTLSSIGNATASFDNTTSTSFLLLGELDFRTGSARRVTIRKCYTTILEIISQRIEFPFSESVLQFPQTSGAWSFVLIGTPGVGKTLFSLYLIHLLIKHNVSFVYDASGHKQLHRGGKFVFGSDAVVAVVRSMIQQEQLIYVVDGQAPDTSISNYMNVSTILVCSPRLQYVDQLTKDHTNRQLKFIYMPTWDLDELEQCRALCYPDFTQEEIKRRYEECGGVARTVFANNYESLWGKIVSAVQECDPRKLFDIEVSKYATYTSNDASHRIVHIFVDPQDYLPFKVAFASQTIQRLVHQKYKEDVNKYLRDFFNVLNPLSSQDASLGLMRGSYFEQFCFYLLVSHKKFSCRHLSGMKLITLKNTDIYEMDSRMFYDNSGRVRCRATYDQIGNFKNNEDDNSVLYVCRKNFPTIDAFHVNHTQKIIYLFQVTSNNGHSLSLGNYEVIEIIKEADSRGVEYTVIFLWLVPWFLFDLYRSQPMKEVGFENPTDLQRKAMASFQENKAFWQNRVHHYCLSVGGVTDLEFAKYIDQV